MIIPPTPFRLNEAQMLLLEIFQNCQMIPAELEALRDTLARHLTDELDKEVERVMKARNITTENIARRTEAINENRTDYKRKVQPV